MEGWGLVCDCVLRHVPSKISWGQNAGCQCTYIQYQDVQEAVGTRHVNIFKKLNNGYNDVVFMNSSWHLHQTTYVII